MTFLFWVAIICLFLTLAASLEITWGTRHMTRLRNVPPIGQEHVPKGWLGKNHALHYGAQRAHGEYLLFTDADIIFQGSTLSRAMRHMLENKLDHVCMSFENIAPGGLLNALILDAASGLMLLLKPWKAKDPKSKRYIGVGAFNLVRASVYTAVDGHRSIAMHPLMT